MKTSTIVLLAVCVAVGVAGCSKAVGDSASEKRAYAQKMKTDTIAELYQEKPEAKAKIANAAGYAVFSNININLFLLSSGNGFGIVHDTSKGEETYMKMRFFGVGLGLATIRRPGAGISATLSTPSLVCVPRKAWVVRRTRRFGCRLLERRSRRRVRMVDSPTSITASRRSR